MLDDEETLHAACDEDGEGEEDDVLLGDIGKSLQGEKMKMIGRGQTFVTQATPSKTICSFQDEKMKRICCGHAFSHKLYHQRQSLQGDHRQREL